MLGDRSFTPFAPSGGNVVIDYRSRQYAAALLDATGAARPLAAVPGGSTRFPIASGAGRRVSAIDLIGETIFTSLLGSWMSIPDPSVLLLQ